MKLIKSLLQEMPYDLGGDAPPTFKQELLKFSENALHREFIFLGDLTLSTKTSEETFSFYLGNTKGIAIVVTKEAYDVAGTSYRKVIVEIRFENRFRIDVPNQLQVKKAFADANMRSRSLSMAMYVLLARYGYTVVSDYEQFAGGINLWKKIARESNIRNYLVRIWTDKLKDWIRDEDGNVVKFDNKNIDDCEIWHTDKYEPTSLLVLTSK